MKQFLITEELVHELVKQLRLEPKAAHLVMKLIRLPTAPTESAKTDAQLMAEYHGRYG